MGEFDHIAAELWASPFTTACMEMTVANDFSRLDKNAAKRQHFLPRLLLRGFAEARNGQDYVFQMETGARKAPRRVNVLTAASRHRLYAGLGDDGQPSNRNEGYLALLEDHAAPALAHLLADPGALAPGERATIAFFVALQKMRTPVAAEQVTLLANAALQRATSELYSDRRAFAERHRAFFDNGATDAEIEQFRVETLDLIRKGEVRVSGRGGAAFSSGFAHAIEMVPALLACDWTLLRAPGGVVTSDRGYAIHDPTPPYPWASQELFSSESSEMTMPLSDTSCLLIRPVHARAALAVRDITPRELQTLNLRTYGWADKHVFAKTQSALDATRVGAKRSPKHVIRPKPFCEVMLLELDPMDDSLAEANVRRGWPSHLPSADGGLRDYIVIPTDQPHPDLRQLADDLAERRARTRAGIGPDTPINGRIVSRAVHPLEMSERGAPRSRT